MTSAASDSRSDDRSLIGRHLRYGWIYILVYLLLGIALESLHGFKVSWYLDVANETRRLTWTLAHAHGVLIGLLNLAFAASLHVAPELAAACRRIASPCLLGAGLLLPGGFLLGGLVIHGGDPGVGVALVPIGAILLLLGVALTARAALQQRHRGGQRAEGI